MSVATAYLEDLNSEQRRAVEHGVIELDCTFGGPLLVIAGGRTRAQEQAPRVAAARSGVEWRATVDETRHYSFAVAL